MNDDTAVTLTKDETIRLQAAEIKRLREENTLLTKGWQPATPTALLDEIERLHSLVYSYPPTEFAPEGVTWQQEAEKLRGLLRWWLTAGGADEDTIREALGK